MCNKNLKGISRTFHSPFFLSFRSFCIYRCKSSSAATPAKGLGGLNAANLVQEMS